MTLTQLQYFQAVCRYENFTKAAEALHISQPAMSAAMKDLERECGVPLFIRNKNSLKVTEEGQVLLDEANLVLGQYGCLDHVVRNLSLSRKYVRVGLSTLSGNQVYPEMLREFKSRYPDIQVMSTEESTKRQFEMLEAGLLDATITIKRMEDEKAQAQFDAEFCHWPMIPTRQVFCVGLDNPLAKESFITMQQISGEPLVLLKDNFSQTGRIKRAFKQRGLEYQVMHYTNQMYTVERFVEKNIAAGFLPESVAKANPQIAGIPYEGTDEAYIEIFWKRDRFLFDAPKKFIETAKELYPKKTAKR